MRMITTKREIKLKDGSTLPKGLPVQFDQTTPHIMTVAGRRVRVSSGFPKPDMEELEEMSNDGVCESVAGHQVEPDGWDHENTPSWLLALGMISLEEIKAKYGSSVLTSVRGTRLTA